MAFLALTYMSSSQGSPTMLYFPHAYTRLMEKMDLIGGFTYSGLHVEIDDFRGKSLGVGVSGNVEDIGTKVFDTRPLFFLDLAFFTGGAGDFI